MTFLDRVKLFVSESFVLDDPRKPRRRRRICRECEIIGSATFLTGAIYMGHITRMGKIMPIPGMMFCIMLGLASVAVLITPPQDDAVKQILEDNEKHLCRHNCKLAFIGSTKWPCKATL
uniref:Uncharacterized protein n=1 Tax=Ciona savignyi TaxID=51511 RepID=H2YHT3_CIOSA